MIRTDLKKTAGLMESRRGLHSQKIFVHEYGQLLQPGLYDALPETEALSAGPPGHLENLHVICIYEIRTEERTHTGVWALTPCEDFKNGRIKGYIPFNGFNGTAIAHTSQGPGDGDRPALITYAAEREINELISSAKLLAPFKIWSSGSEEHLIWEVNEPQLIQKLIKVFSNLGTAFLVNADYLPDSQPSLSEQLFPFSSWSVAGAADCFSALYMADDQLISLPCHQLLKPGFPVNPENFFRMISKDFDVMTSPGNRPVEPGLHHHFGLYLEGQWYQLILKQTALVGAAFPARIDANILYTHILLPTRLLSGSEQGIRSMNGKHALKFLLEELDQDRSLMAITLYPVSLNQLISLCYVDGALPPKTTCIDPQIRSGLLMSR